MKVVRNKTGNDNFSNAQHLSFALSLMADGCFNDAIMAFKEILKHDFSSVLPNHSIIYILPYRLKGFLFSD